MALEDLRVSGKDDFRDGDIVQVTDARLTVRQQVNFIRRVEKREGCLLANGLREPRVPSLEQTGKQLELISEPLAFHRERANPCGEILQTECDDFDVRRLQQAGAILDIALESAFHEVAHAGNKHGATPWFLGEGNSPGDWNRVVIHGGYRALDFPPRKDAPRAQ